MRWRVPPLDPRRRDEQACAEGGVEMDSGVAEQPRWLRFVLMAAIGVLALVPALTQLTMH
jgi:hypothetical protein